MVPGPNDPIKDPVLSKSKRLIKALLFIAVGYLVYYLLIDMVLLRPNLGDKNMLLLNWVFFVVWTLMSFITVASIYWPDLQLMQGEVSQAEMVKTPVEQKPVAEPTPQVSVSPSEPAPKVVPRKKTVKKKAKKVQKKRTR